MTPVWRRPERSGDVNRRRGFVYAFFHNAAAALDIGASVQAVFSRSVIDFRLMAIVDELCSSADVAGGRIPATPSAISAELKPMIKR